MKFGTFNFDPETERLTREGAVMPLGQRAAKLLAILLSQRGETVSKEALMDAAWSKQAVEESNLTVQMAALRRALGTTADGNEWIVTVPRIGYRFVTGGGGSGLGSSTEPSIAVLRFANLSSDPEQEYFAAGLAEDLITDLSKVSGLMVISRDSSFAFRDQGGESYEVARDLGVEYLVRGSVRRAAHRVRINAWLIDAAEESPIWADRFDGDLMDVFALQDRVVGSILTALANVLPIAAPPRPRRQPNLEAYDTFVRGRQLVMQSPQGNLEGRELLERAAQMDPGFAEPHAWMAMSHVHGWLTWGQPLGGNSANRAVEAGRDAVARDVNNADAHAFLGYALSFNRQPVEAEAELATALRLNPNHADAMALHAELLTNAGQIDAALTAMEQALRLNPYPPPWYRWMQGFVFHAAGRYEEVVATLTHETMRGTASGRILAAALAHLGRLEEARAAAREFLRIVPSFCNAEWIASQPLTDPVVRERFVGRRATWRC